MENVTSYNPTRNTAAQETADLAQTARPESPRRDWLRLISIGLAVIGLGISGYITYGHLSGTGTVCAETGLISCDLVQSSVYSRLFGIPIQFIGVGGYLAILAVLGLESVSPLFASRGKLLVFAMTLFGFLYSAYLTAIEAFVLNAWCLWCVGSAVTMTLLFGVSFVRMWRSLNAPIVDDELVEDAEPA